ncbi:unnamed protein product [Darwinula stevensoni]|uniref:Uncharacterized protein n=1 Tax=Darwinula stevensoni TaxID=69355 RepID=A0A7R9A232_9CRUS|nr:unnamed protein product [Darwinula stevensoni]CAG0888932.1 unnamed protein product [Darwinula stevensoni]
MDTGHGTFLMSINHVPLLDLITPPAAFLGPSSLSAVLALVGGDGRVSRPTECVVDNDFVLSGDNCISDPASCSDSGFSFSFFFKEIVYWNDEFATKPSTDFPKAYLISTGGDELGHPGLAIYRQGMDLVASLTLKDGTVYEIRTIYTLSNNTWNNVAMRWQNPLNGSAGLELVINMQESAALRQPTRKVSPKNTLNPPTLMIGCHKTADNPTYRDFGGGQFDELAGWRHYIPQSRVKMFLGGYVDRNHHGRVLVLSESQFNDRSVDDVIAALKTADLSNQAVQDSAWRLLESQSNSQLVAPKVDPMVAQVTGAKVDTPAQSLEKFLGVVQQITDSKYIAPNYTEDAFAKRILAAAAVSDNLMHSNKDAWDEIAKTGYKAGMIGLVNDFTKYAMSTLDALSLPDNKEQYSLNLPLDTYVSQLLKIRREELEKQATFTMPNYSDPLWEKSDSNGRYDAWGDPKDTVTMPTSILRYCYDKGPINIVSSYYKNLNNLTDASKVNPLNIPSGGLQQLDSRILTLQAQPSTDATKLSKDCVIHPTDLANSGGIIINLQHLDPEPAKIRKLLFHTEDDGYHIMVRRCVRFNEEYLNYGVWDSSNCVVLDTNAVETKCQCQQFGMYAVLSQRIQQYLIPVDPTWLTIIRYVGFSLSVLCLVILILVVACNREHLWEQFHLMRMNMAIACTFGTVAMLVGDFVRDDRHGCTAVSVLLHYFYTAVAAWLAMESLAGFLAINYGIVGGLFKPYFAFCWGLPLVSVGTALLMDMMRYGTDLRCMISFDNDIKLIFFGPLIAFAIVGFLLAAIVACNLTAPRLRKDNTIAELVPVCKGLVVVQFYFDVTWIFGVVAYFHFNWSDQQPSFYPLFQLLNAFTGVLILLFMGFYSPRFRMVLTGAAEKRKMLLLANMLRGSKGDRLDESETASPQSRRRDSEDEDYAEFDRPETGRRVFIAA